MLPYPNWVLLFPYWVLKLPKLGIIIPKMGRQTEDYKGFAAALFSKVQLRLLNLLIGHPNQAFHTSEIIKRVQSGTGAVQRELVKLAEAGILTSASDGNRRIYQANKQAPIFKELSGIILKTTGLVEPIRDSLTRFQNQIRLAFIYGSIANGTDTANSDVDLMIVGEELSYSEIFGALEIAEKAISRPINPNIMTPPEWSEGLSSGNSFVRKIFENPKLIVLGTEHELKGT